MCCPTIISLFCSVPFRIVFPNGAVVEWVDERMERTKELLGLVASLP
ncbi:MAG: hypothetical protein HQL80_11020 [Magnetococcales bacterium]|nr:hypothetical protein [Magnetococcales bacterium]